MLIIFFIGHEWLENILDIKVSLAIIIMSMISIFFGGFYQACYYWLVRQQCYQILSKSRIAGAVSLAFVSSIFGFLGFGAEGLIVGMVAGQAANLLFIYKHRSSFGSHIKWFGWKKVFESAKLHFDNPRFLILSGILNRFSSQSQILLLSNFFGASVGGALGLYQKAISLPVQLIGNSISVVFKQHASVEFNDNGECLKLFYSTAVKLFFLGITPFVLLLTIAPIMFEIVFGSQWRIAGEFAQILCCNFFIGFIVSPLTSLFFIAKKQNNC